MRRILAMTIAVALWSCTGFADDSGEAAETTKAKEFTIVSIQYEGTKIWLPGSIAVNKGDKVKIKLMNKIPTDPNQHGFSLPDFKVTEVVTRGDAKTVEFVADKAGVFPFFCQLHAAHIGGQLIVLD